MCLIRPRLRTRTVLCPQIRDDQDHLGEAGRWKPGKNPETRGKLPAPAPWSPDGVSLRKQGSVPEGRDGAGGGRGVQDGEHMYTQG